MIVKENVTIYVCDHCKKKLYVRQAMERHEKWCTKNPENYKACGGCVYLEDIKVPYDVYKYPDTFKDQQPMTKECEHSTPMY